VPTSHFANIPPIIDAAQQIQPRKVLDLGSGSGKYLVLFREALDIAYERLLPRQWKVTIDSVEGFERYISSLHYSVANSVAIEDFSDMANWPKYVGYDLVTMIDSFEHINKETGMMLLYHLRQKNRRIIISCPYGENYLEQGAVYGNEFERHRAHWTPGEFEKLGARILYKGICFVALF
jgi:hypothetical protein